MRRATLRVVACLLLTALASVPASAQSYDDAVAAHKRGDAVVARQILQPLAAAGDARAQYALAAMHVAGDGGPVDNAAAAQLFRKAAEGGHMQAQRMLAAMYGFGLGVTQSYEEAAKWYLRAAAQGDATAQTSLGLLYENGLGVAADPVEALKWYELVLNRYPTLRSGENVALLNRDRVAAKLTPEQIREAEKRASEWTAKKE